MKEITIITTCEITEIMKVEDNGHPIVDKQFEQDAIKDLLHADDVKIKKQQVFVRDLT